MSGTDREQPATETQERVGRVVESAEQSSLSKLWARAQACCILISTVFLAGVWLTQQKHDLDWKAHLAEDKETQLKVAQEREEHQKRLTAAEERSKAAEAEVERLKGRLRESQAGGYAFEHTVELLPARPPKEPTFIILVPKSD